MMLIWLWLRAHPIVVWSVVYVVLNVAPRPHPAEKTGWKLLLWGTIDRLCVLSAAHTPGTIKALFSQSEVEP